MNFTVLWLYAKVSSAKFGVWHFWHSKSEQSAKDFFSKIAFFTNLQKFSSSKFPAIRYFSSETHGGSWCALVGQQRQEKWILSMLLLLFIQQKHKTNEMAFLTSRYANKHVYLAVGVEHMAWDNGGVPYMFICYVGLVSLSFTRLKLSRCCTACHKSLGTPF